jgi:hypothetical protein
MNESTLDDFAVTLEFTVKEINALLNILNNPLHTNAVSLVTFIQLIQMQAGPQVEKAQEGLKAVEKAQKKNGK